jgi:hypothetical protein
VVWTDLAQVMNFGFHKMLESSSVAAQLAASEEGLSSMKLVIHICTRRKLDLCDIGNQS